MKTRFIRLISKSLSVLLVLIIVLSLCSTYVGATSENSDTVVVVSLGDSYSSGEGIPEFYGQNQSLSTTVRNYDWLAHRSKKSWGSLLEIPGVNNKMGNYLEQITDFNGNEDGSNLIKNGTSACKWYFVASSGAETKHFKNEPQNKSYDKIVGSGFSMMYHVAGSKDLPPQLNIFDKITDTVDYVTLTVGGNDVKFADVITSCVTGSSYLGFNLVGKYLDDLIDDIWKDIENTKSNIKEVYRAIHQKAPNATIIVAGYPELLNKDGKGFTISKEEATTVNNNVIKFNKIIKDLIAECKSEMDIEYVDVASEFNLNGGHQAYSDNAWINPVWLNKKSQDLEDSGVGSAYSVHPNEEGAKAYARCVNQKIEEVESRRRIYPGTLSGKICKASDRNTPIPNARITVSNNSRTVHDVSSSSGNYSIRLPEGQYYITIHADNYIDFGCYATVKKDENTYMETFLMVEGEEGMVGIAKGSVFNSLTGSAVPGINLSVRKDWNNTDTGAEILASTVTDSSGSYTLELPYGNYTVAASKEGYLTSTFNIIVQSGTTGNQNGTITPIVDGDEYLITLTWGENPRDLDSHVVGTLSNDREFHVFYNHKSQYDGDIEVCNLDYDDTTSYGPEHITLKPTTSKPYYYYIYRYAGSGTVASSSAKITVHKGNQLIASYNVPTNLGSDDYWNVFAIKNGQIINKNSITSSADTNYAN